MGQKVAPAPLAAAKCPILCRSLTPPGCHRQNREVVEMQVKFNLSRMALVALGIICLSGCASSPVQPSGMSIKQDPITSHMRSQVGTPDELSPLAPPTATNIQKVGNHWTCEMNGQPMIYNDAAASWEPRGSNR
jgi:hypothetical protein